MRFLTRKEYKTSPVPALQERAWSEEDIRDAVLRQLVLRYVQRTAQVFKEQKIGGQVVEWNVSPRYLSVGVVPQNSRDVAKTIALTREIGVMCGLGQGTLDPPIYAVFMRDMVVYQFPYPEQVFIRNRTLRLWEDIFVDDERLFDPVRGWAVAMGMYDVKVHFSFDDAAPHALVAGSSGAGKTEAIKTIVYQLMRNNAVDEIAFGIVDIKNDYWRFNNKAHLLWQPAREAEEITNLVAQFHTEYKRRRGLTPEQAKLCQRWVLVIDEGDDPRTLQDPDIQQWVLDIAHRGRSLNMNLIIGTHMPDKDSLGPIDKELTYRWLGKQATAQAAGRVAAGLGLHKLGAKGDFFVTTGDTAFRCQLAMVRPGDYAKLPDRHVDLLPADMPTTPEPVELPDLLPAGREKIYADPRSVAFYLRTGIDKVTIAMAEKALGLKRQGHYINREFAKELVKEMKGENIK